MKQFNIYGAYKIDFSALKSIEKMDGSSNSNDNNEDNNYVLDLRAFCEDLKSGDFKKLHEAKKNIPEVFESNRFIDYLSCFADRVCH